MTADTDDHDDDLDIDDHHLGDNHYDDGYDDDDDYSNCHLPQRAWIRGIDK